MKVILLWLPPPTSRAQAIVFFGDRRVSCPQCMLLILSSNLSSNTLLPCVKLFCPWKISPPVHNIACYILLVATPCIMHRCVISTMFGWCFWFFKKTFLFKQLLVPPSPWSFAFPTSIFYPVDPPAWSFAFLTPVLYPVDPPRPVLRISHSGSLTRQAPSPGPSHFSLQFFNLSIPSGRSFTFLTPVL